MLRVAIVLAFVVTAARAHAGPWCGGGLSFAPAEASVVPPSPTLAFFIEENYYNGIKERGNNLADHYADGPPRRRPRNAPFVATIDGQRVPVTVKTVRTRDGLLKLIKIKSRRTGALRIVTSHPYEDEIAATYTIDRAWQPAAPSVVSVERQRDGRIGPYRWVGHFARVRVDTPVIAFDVAWRRDADSEWRSQRVAASIDDSGHELQIGQRMCGMTENVPLAFLERGIEMKVRAQLPSGEWRDVTNVPAPLAIPAETP